MIFNIWLGYVDVISDWQIFMAMLWLASLLLVVADRMWRRLPQADAVVRSAPRLAT